MTEVKKRPPRKKSGTDQVAGSQPGSTGTDAGNGSNGIEDIEHEDLGTNKPAQVTTVTAEEITVESQVKQEIVKFNFTDAAIDAMKKAYSGLTIADENDKEGYKAVKEAWNDVRSRRTGLEKKGLSLRQRYNEISKAIVKEEDRLIDMVKPLEDDLYKKWKTIDEAKEAEKKRKQEEEEQRTQQRIREITDLGMVLRDGFYQIGETISMDVATLRGMNDEQYVQLKGVIQKKAEELQRLREQEDQRKREEDERQQQERLRLQQEQQKLEQEREAFRKQQQELQQQQEEMKKQIREGRNNSMINIGFTRTPTGYTYQTPIMEEPIRFDWDVLDVSPDSWAAFITDLKKKVVDHEIEHDKYQKEKKEQEEKIEQRKELVAAKMAAIGFTYQYRDQAFVFQKEAGTVSAWMASMIRMGDEDLQVYVDNIEIQKNEIIEKQAEIDQKREAKRQELMGDKEIMREYIAELQKVKTPANVLKTDAHKNMLEGIRIQLQDYAKALETI